MTADLPFRIERIDHTNADLARQIEDLWQRAYSKEAEWLGLTDFPPLRRSLDHIIASKTQFIGGCDKQRLVAVIEISLQGSMLDISSLLVDPDSFRKGYASRLLAWVLDTLSWQRVTVSTAIKNIPAVKLYQKFGFQEVQRSETPEKITLVTFERTRPPINTFSE